MVITFNKRELLEFANWTINQSKLPRAFVVADDDEKLKEVMNVLQNKFNQGWNLATDFKPKGDFLFVRMKMINPEREFCSNWVTPETTGLPVLAGYEVIAGMLFEDTPYLDSDDVDLWLEHEKHIKPIHIGMVAPN